MNRLSALAAILALSTHAASAADLRPPLPTKAPVVVAAPPASWSGFYVGAHVGYGWTNAQHDFFFAGTPDGSSTRIKLDGLVGGVTAGYNGQWSNLLLGVETDFSFADFSGVDLAADPAGCNSADCRSKMNWFGTVRGRGGIVFDRVLAYVTGGGAYGRIRIIADNPFTYNFSKTSWGWTVGGGFEVMFTPQWTAKAEYLYIDLGDVGGLYLAPSSSVEARFRVNVARIGINYKFAPGPVVARY